MNLEELRKELATTYRYLDSYEDVCRHHYEQLALMREERNALALELNAWKARRCETCWHRRDREEPVKTRYVCDLADLCAPNGFIDWEAKTDGR